MKALIIAACCLMATPVGAQVSAVQQCIWGCLYGPGGGNPSSPAYEACVVQNCVEDGASDTSPQASWTTGEVAGGQGVFANIDDPQSGRGLAWVCDAAGRSYFVLDADLNGPGGAMALVVDGQRFATTFTRNPDWLEASVPPDAPVLTALASGTQAQLMSTDGQILGTFSLRGSSAAISQVRRRCG